MLTILMGLYFIYAFIKIVLNLLEIQNIKKTRVQKAIILGEVNYQKAADYKLANEKFAIFSGLYDFILFLLWALFGFGALQDALISDGGILDSILFVLIFIAINYILGLPFDIYNTFIKDKKFGFSTIDVKTYVLDQIKGGVLFLVFGSLVVGLISWIVLNLPLWWIWGFGVIMVLMVVINLIYPTFIAPLFNKFKPLEDEDLKEAIGSLLAKAGLNSDGVFSIDASKRDKRLNAFFGGLGKSKRVVLYDTLLQKVGKNELLAVLGHELGHFKHKDIIKKIALMGLMLFLMFGVFGNLPLGVYGALGLKPSAYGAIVIFMLLSPVLFFALTPIMGYASRHDEYAADEYGSECQSKEDLANALIKLADENKSYPHSHPLNVIFYHTHPPLIQRLEALGVDFSDS
ncbi:MAG: peptidase M48 [Proteobacteria bacterium]|nr:MAG: peptidase M48 [Pseudomonadota bacterium]